MRRLVPFLAWTFLTFVSGSVRAEDPWFGRDKLYHFGASGTIALGGYAAARQFCERPCSALWAGGIALGVGLGKEGADALGYGHPSWKDLAWDAIGTSAGLALGLMIDLAYSSSTGHADSSFSQQGLRLTF